jgi:hypothetical protein
MIHQNDFLDTILLRRFRNYYLKLIVPIRNARRERVSIKNRQSEIRGFKPYSALIITYNIPTIKTVTEEFQKFDSSIELLTK